MNWEIDKDKSFKNESLVWQEVVFKVEGKTFVRFKNKTNGKLDRKVFGNVKLAGAKDFPWEEISIEAKRLLIPETLPGKKSTSPGSKADGICYEVVETEALWLYEQVEKEFTSLRRHGSKKSRTEVVDELIKVQAKELTIERMPLGLRSNCRRLRVFGVKFLTDGCLALSRWTKIKNQDGEDSLKIVFQRFSDLEAAIRSHEHILEKYLHAETGELMKLNSIEQIITRANELLVNWGLASSQEKRQIKRDLLSVVDNLFYCTNEFKERACEQTLKAVSLKDRLNRTNPPAMAARTQAALENLAKRFEELRLIEPFIAMRQELLKVELNREKFLFKEAAKYARQGDALLAIRIIDSAILSPWFARKNQAEYCLLMSLTKTDADQKKPAKDFLEQAVKTLQSE